MAKLLQLSIFHTKRNIFITNVKIEKIDFELEKQTDLVFCGLILI